jgi:putative flippase GtrA
MIKKIFIENRDKKIKYLLAGIINTSFSYLLGIYIYTSYSKYFGIILTLVLVNILSISFSFLSYKIFVFKSRGNWILEYFKSYLVYGITAIVSIIGVWILVEIFSLKFWLAQGCLMIMCIIFSFCAHSKFTYRNNHVV